MSRVQYNSFKPPKKVSWWDRLFLRVGDVWEERINEWGTWDTDYLSRWIWDGRKWQEDLT